MESIEKQKVLKALCLSWALRAMGMQSHAGFTSCMERVLNYCPDEVRAELEKQTVHHHEFLYSWVQRELVSSPDVGDIVGGDLPTIQYLEAMEA